MLVINVDIWPFGDANRSAAISTVLVAQVRVEGGVADYKALYAEDGRWYECDIVGHRREEGALVLLGAVLAADSIPLRSEFGQRVLTHWSNQVKE